MRIGKIEGNDYNNLIMNDAINAFRIAVGDNISLQNMVDMFVDEYEDETGIDTASNINALYNATDDYYSLGEGDTTAIDNMEYSTNPIAQDTYRTSAGGGTSDIKLLLHCDGADEGTTFTDHSGYDRTATVYGLAELDTTNKKWGTASLYNRGNSNNTSKITFPDSADWEITQQTNFTVDLWVKHTDHVGSETYVMHNESQTYQWKFQHIHGTGLYMNVYSSGTQLSLLGGEITDTDWHHVALCKVGDDYGIYKDGTQVAHTNSSYSTTRAGTLEIGGATTTVNYTMDGYLDDIRISHANEFSASPNVGKTDTITIPTSAHKPNITDGDLVSFSEDTIKEQGSYSLKIVAKQTDSLNETLTNNISSPIDLSNRDIIKFKARASRTGTQFQIQIHDSGGTTSTYNVAISSANTWETKEWDISGISSANRDAIDQIIIKITNADSINTIYIDEMYGYALPTGMTLMSENQLAESEPDEARIIILMEEVSSITLNTDLKAYVSRDDGSTWVQATLTDNGDYGNNIKILYGEVDLTTSGIGSGTDIVYKITTHNSKNGKIHGTSVAWR